MNDSLVISVASAIRHFRKQKNLSQEALASRSTLDRTYISGVERGVRNISLQSLELIIDALEVSHKDFFGRIIETEKDGI